MAYGLTKISPLDLRPSTGIGVSIPFSAENVFTTVYTTKDQTKYNLINFILTNPRERVFNPTFGAGLRSRLFEQIENTTFEEIKSSMISQIERYFPQVEIVDLTVSGSPDRQTINLNFSYRLKRTRESDSVTITVQNT